MWFIVHVYENNIIKMCNCIFSSKHKEISKTKHCIKNVRIIKSGHIYIDILLGHYETYKKTSVIIVIWFYNTVAVHFFMPKWASALPSQYYIPFFSFGLQSISNIKPIRV